MCEVMKMKVVLYSTKCPKCLIVEKKLKDKGIEFEEVTNINAMLEKGFMVAPMLEVDGEVMDYTKAINWVMEEN